MGSMTDHPPSVVDAETFTVRRSIRIAAPLEKVWSAVTEPELISRWFGRAELDGSAVGATGTLTWDDRGAVPLRIEAIDEPRMVAYRWSNAESGALPTEVEDERSTVFTFTLEPVPDGTRLTVVETGFEAMADPVADLESHRAGWDHELDELVALLGSDA